MVDESLRDRLTKEIGRCTSQGGRLYSKCARTRDGKPRDYCTYFDFSFSQRDSFQCPHVGELVEIEVPSGMTTSYIEFYRCNLCDRRA